jgi:hypothetical protein
MNRKVKAWNVGLEVIFRRSYIDTENSDEYLSHPFPLPILPLVVNKPKSTYVYKKYVT